MASSEEPTAHAADADRAEYVAKFSKLIESANPDDVVELFRLSTVTAAAAGVTNNNNNNNNNNNHPKLQQ